MTNETTSESTPNNIEPSERALLTEYQACQNEAGGAVSWSWQSGVIFFVTTLALAGAIISGLINTDYNIYRLFLIFVFGLFSIILLYVWDRYLIRQNLIRRVMFYRMRMIERKLNLRKGLYVSFLDKTLKNNPLEEDEKGKLLTEFCENRGRTPQGLKLTRYVVRVTIVAWVILIVLEAAMYFFPVFRQWLLDCRL